MPTRLDRDTIVAAALEIVENEGPDALSMRRLAADLDSKPMTLYHYVPNKAALLTLILSEVAKRMDWPKITGTPRDRMVGIVIQMHDTMAGVPWLIDVLRRGVATGIPALALVDDFLAAGLEAGLDERRSFDLWRSCWGLVASELQWRNTMSRRRPDETSWFETVRDEDLADYPLVRALLPQWPTLSATYDVRSGIGALVDGTLGAL